MLDFMDTYPTLPRIAPADKERFTALHFLRDLCAAYLTDHFKADDTKKQGFSMDDGNGRKIRLNGVPSTYTMHLR